MTFLPGSLPSPKVNQQVGGAGAGREPSSGFRPFQALGDHKMLPLP